MTIIMHLCCIYILRETNNHLHEWFFHRFHTKKPKFFFVTQVRSSFPRYSFQSTSSCTKATIAVFYSHPRNGFSSSSPFCRKRKMNQSKTVKVDLLWRQRESFMPLHFSGSPFKIQKHKRRKEKISSQQLCCVSLNYLV